MVSPTCIMISPDVFMISPRCTHGIPPMYLTPPDVLNTPPDVLMVSRCIHDINRCTHGIPPMYSWYPPDVLNTPRCTEHTLYRVISPSCLQTSFDCAVFPIYMLLKTIDNDYHNLVPFLYTCKLYFTPKREL